MKPGGKLLRFVLSVGVVCIAFAGLRAQVPKTAEMDDEQFLTHLTAATPGSGGVPELDRRRLAKLFFGLGSTLASGKANVRMLQGAMQLRGSAAASGRQIVGESYAGYDDAVERLRAQASAFLDNPDSNPVLFEVVSGGHEVCWRLDAYTRLVETYGVALKDLVSILSSREACNQFRRAAFSKPVQHSISNALESAGLQEQQLKDLQNEINELEQLVEDLREIEQR